MEDLIENYINLTEDEFSPEIFRKWAGIALVGGALERRVWVRTGDKITFCNMYILLTGAPGSGKSIVNHARFLMSMARDKEGKTAFCLSPDDMTPAALIDELVAIEKIYVSQNGNNYVSSPLFIFQEEMAILMPQYDMGFVGKLLGIWNNPENAYIERRRAREKQIISINYPMINLLVGVTPQYISGTFPAQVWETGLSRRVFMVFDDTPMKYIDPFKTSDALLKKQREEKILSQLTNLSSWFGAINWTEAAESDFRNWWIKMGQKTAPSHTKLIAYSKNRMMNLIKLSAISVASRGAEDKRVTIFDFNRAKDWLLEIEEFMPDIFRAMAGKGDYDIIEELHRFMTSMWMKNGRKPIDKESIMRFLGEIVTGNKAIEVLLLAESAGFIRRDPTKAKEHYLPMSKIIDPGEKG